MLHARHINIWDKVYQTKSLYYGKEQKNKMGVT